MRSPILIPMMNWGLILILIPDFSLPRTLRLPEILGRMIEWRLSGQKLPVVSGD